ncbi:MAG: peptidoglycan DD-metalloendopeptidase family protein [Pseudomonadota bacterium]|nr:peptidoglycan DD-metalloendopeptidase family protein [Pseudomonadota bacterium]
MRIVIAIAVLVAAFVLPSAPASAQSSRDTERKLQRVRGELKDIAAEQRKLEGERGTASRDLRKVDEQVGASARALSQTETELVRGQATLARLQKQRDVLQSHLRGQREELARLLRAAYTVGRDAPLKVMLAQDRVSQAGRTLTYHRYLQRDRAERIAQLTEELRGLETVERQIVDKRAALDNARSQRRAELAQLERDRKQRAGLMAQLDTRYKDRAAREKALGRDAKSLEQLLSQLRAAAAKAAREARAAKQRTVAKSPKSPKSSKSNRAGSTSTSPPRTVASAMPIKVGGLGWPLNGTLLAGYGGTMPDGRASAGVLIGAPVGSSVRAVADGRVVFAEWMSGYGLISIVDHGNGYMSLYAHNDALLRDAGDSVKRGDAIASVGNSGGQGRPALYFELRRNGQPVNPGAWLQKQ